MKKATKIEDIINCLNLGIDYDAFDTAEELISYLENEYEPENEDRLVITDEMREELVKIFDQYPKTLTELTGQRSGIVVYDTGVIVTNWAYSCRNGGLPRLLGQIIIAWPDEIKVIKEYNIADIRNALPGTIVPGVEENTITTENMEIIYDELGNIPALWGYDIGLGAGIGLTGGTVYELGGLDERVTVIAPDDWV